MLRVRGLSGVLRRIKAEVTSAAMAESPARAELHPGLTAEAIARRTIRCDRDERHARRCRNRSRWRAARSCLPGGKKLVEVDGRAIALFNVDGRLLCHRRRLHPRRRPAGRGRALDGCEIQCPRHGARFDVRTGKPLCMPAFEPVPTHQVDSEGDDVFVVIQD